MDDFYDIEGMSKVEYKEMEDTMNRFAGALLVPEEVYRTDLQTNAKTEINFYIQMKKKYGVSAAALKFLLNAFSLSSPNIITAIILSFIFSIWLYASYSTDTTGASEEVSEEIAMLERKPKLRRRKRKEEHGSAEQK